ncbi:MAG TPA: hypothetical protein VFE47_29460 [Tepidisphaeraceae bacterium]|jgi:hypothetical protein|nr:hypothetical protein [Tepidisphaeraceae bacterium]
MERDRFSLVSHSERRRPHWRLSEYFSAGVLRRGPSVASIWAFVWLAILYLCALVAFHGAGH